MILVDTSVWIDHLHMSDPTLTDLLEDGQVCMHPMVQGELALGSMRRRRHFLDLLSKLPSVPLASHEEVLRLIDARRLHGKGLALVDAHLLASALITPGVLLWTRDRRLREAAAPARVMADLP